MQKATMKFDPATGKENPYPSKAVQYRAFHGVVAWIYNPWTGLIRDARDIGTDVTGRLIDATSFLSGDSEAGKRPLDKEKCGTCCSKPQFLNVPGWCYKFPVEPKEECLEFVGREPVL